MNYSFKLTICLLSITPLFAMESEKRAKIDNDGQSNSNSSSPKRTEQRPLKYWNPRLPITPAECETIDLSEAVCFLKSGNRTRVTNLKELSFSSCKLSKVPKGFSALTALTKLGLEHNNFIIIPE